MKTMTGKQLGEKLLRSVRQMQRGEAARTTRVKPNATAKGRAAVGLSRAEFAVLQGVDFLPADITSYSQDST